MDATRKEDAKSFSGYQWTYFSSLNAGPIRSRAESFLDAVKWPRLLEYTSKQRNGANSSILPAIGLGGNHMVRIIEFDDGVRWVARLQLPLFPDSGSSEGSLEAKSSCEFNTIRLLTRTSAIPIPAIHAFEPGRDSGVNAPFSLMDCLEGNVGMDLGMDIPTAHKKKLLRADTIASPTPAEVAASTKAPATIPVPPSEAPNKPSTPTKKSVNDHGASSSDLARAITTTNVEPGKESLQD